MAKPGIDPGPLTYDSDALPTLLRGPATQKRPHTENTTQDKREKLKQKTGTGHLRIKHNKKKQKNFYIIHLSFVFYI